MAEEGRVVTYGARRTNGQRATKAGMETRRETVVQLVEASASTSVRHVYYQAIGVHLVEKDTKKSRRNYNKIQRTILDLRRSGRIPYEAIVDSTRYMLKRESYFDVEDALNVWSQNYRRDHWMRGDVLLEVWCESQSIAGVLSDVTDKWGLPLFPCKGYSSETFAYEAAANWRIDERDPVILYVGDLDLHGKQIEQDLRRKLEAFYGRSVVWVRVGLTEVQVKRHGLEGLATAPGHWEAEVLPADVMRNYLGVAIEDHWDAERFAPSLAAEESEREILASIIATKGGGVE